MCPYFGGELLIWGSSDYGNEQIMGPLRRRRTLNLTHYAKSHASENTHQWVATSWSFWTCNQNFVLIFCKILLQLKKKTPLLRVTWDDPFENYGYISGSALWFCWGPWLWTVWTTLITCKALVTILIPTQHWYVPPILCV